jgi:hypothetical protein
MSYFDRFRLLPFDWLVDVVAFWRLSVVCRLVQDVANWQLVRSAAFNPGYRWAQRPGRTLPATLFSPAGGLSQLKKHYPGAEPGAERIVERSAFEQLVNAQIPPLPEEMIARIRSLTIRWEQCDQALREVSFLDNFLIDRIFKIFI